jgi:hypothetical protein
MRILKILLFATLAVFYLPIVSTSAYGQTLAETILQKSIEYHDPDDVWPAFATVLIFDETRPNADTRKTSFSLDNSSGSFEVDRAGTERHGFVMDSCYVLKGDVDCERARTLRNYYLYLWGLPMKLLDPGTAIDKYAEKVVYESVPAFEIRVPYQKDTWYFYFDESTYRLLAYKFYQNEEETSGEWIKLEDEINVGGILIPKKRSWYTLPEGKYLGSDILSGTKSSD